MSGADIILRVLAEQGVDTLFGYSGGAILPTYDAVFRFNETHKAHPNARSGLSYPPMNRLRVSWPRVMLARAEKSAYSW